MKPANVREQILESAIYLLRHFGYGSVRYTEIAKHAKINKQAVYYHFPDHDDILLAIAERWTQTGQQITLQVLADSPYSQSEKILSIAEGMYDWMVAHPEVASVGVSLFQCSTVVPKIKEYMATARKIGRERIKSYLLQDSRFFNMKNKELEKTITACHAIMYGSFFYIAVLEDKENLDLHRKQCLQILRSIIDA